MSSLIFFLWPPLLVARTSISRSSAANCVMTFSTVCAMQHRLVAILVQTPSVPLHYSRGGDLYIYKNSAFMETRISASLMHSTSSSKALLSPSTRLVGAAAHFPGRTGGLAAGLVLDPCLALVSRCWQLLKETFPVLFTSPLPKAVSKSRIHMLLGAPKRNVDSQISKACSVGLYVPLRALITRWPNFGPR